MFFYSDIISSRQNPIVKWAASLSDKKFRENERCFIAEGEKLCFEAAKSGLPITHIFVSESKKNSLTDKIAQAFCDKTYKDTKVIFLSDSSFEKISTEKAPQGVIIVIKYLDFFRQLDIIYKEDFFLSPNERALALCSLRDPGNLGAVIRSAVAFGINHIILSSDSADIYNPKTIRSAMGGLFKIKVTTVKDFGSFIKCATDVGRRVFAAELSESAVELKSVSLSESDIFVIGNEGHGIPSQISEECTDSVYIPISENTESLNAAVAASILIWEQSKSFGE